jgi:Flp pilus assembly protein TadG
MTNHRLNFRKGKIRMTAHRAAICGDTGQAFVELALVLPIFVLLLLGAAELGRLAYASIAVANAARAGVAYGAQNHITAHDVGGIQTAATQDAPNITSMATPAVAQACSCSSGVAITCANAGTNCLSPNRIIEYVRVNTSASVDTVFHFPGIPNTVTLQGQAIMRVQQ